MATEVFMPKLSNTMTEGQLVKWLKKDGDFVKKGEPLMEVMTDKVNMEVEAPETGVLRILIKESQQMLEIGSVLGLICEKNEKIPEKYLKDKTKHKNTTSDKEAAGDNIEKQTERKAHKKNINLGKKKITPRARKLMREKKVEKSELLNWSKTEIIKEKDVLEFLEQNALKISPTAKKIVDENNLDVDKIKGTGINGKIMKHDVEKYLHDLEKSEDHKDYKTSSLKGVRKIIAERMVNSKFTAPHVYFAKKINMINCVEFRKKINAKLAPEKTKISYTNIISFAVSRLLKKYSQLNSWVVEDEIRTFNHCNLAIAVDTEQGLLVPVIPKADSKSLLELSREMNEIIEMARKNMLKPDSLKGGSFTISNLGSLGIDCFTAIINPPQTAILAVGAIVDEPVVVNNDITIRPMMNLVLSVDHRLIDGALAAKFLNELKDMLENPEYLILE